MVRRANPVLGRFDAERFAIVEKSLHEFRGVVADTYAGSSGIGDDAVIHIGQVHHVVQLESAQLQKPPQNILKNEGAVIPDVRVVVDSRPALYHADFPRFWRTEIPIFPPRFVLNW